MSDSESSKAKDTSTMSLDHLPEHLHSRTDFDVLVEKDGCLLPCYSPALIINSKVLAQMLEDTDKGGWGAGVAAALGDASLHDAHLFLAMCHRRENFKTDLEESGYVELVGVVHLAHKLDAPEIIQDCGRYLELKAKCLESPVRWLGAAASVGLTNIADLCRTEIIKRTLKNTIPSLPHLAPITWNNASEWSELPGAEYERLINELMLSYRQALNSLASGALRTAHATVQRYMWDDALDAANLQRAAASGGVARPKPALPSARPQPPALPARQPASDRTDPYAFRPSDFTTSAGLARQALPPKPAAPPTARRTPATAPKQQPLATKPKVSTDHKAAVTAGAWLSEAAVGSGGGGAKAPTASTDLRLPSSLADISAREFEAAPDEEEEEQEGQEEEEEVVVVDDSGSEGEPEKEENKVDSGSDYEQSSDEEDEEEEEEEEWAPRAKKGRAASGSARPSAARQPSSGKTKSIALYSSFCTDFDVVITDLTGTTMGATPAGAAPASRAAPAPSVLVSDAGAAAAKQPKPKQPAPKPAAPKKPRGAAGAATMASADLVLPRRVVSDPAGGAVLVELPPGIHLEGLTGAGGAVGRLQRGGPGSGMILDLLGIQYETEVVPLPVSMAVAHRTGASLVIDSIFDSVVRGAALPGQAGAGTGESVFSMTMDKYDSDMDWGEEYAGPGGKKKKKKGNAATKRRPAAPAPKKRATKTTAASKKKKSASKK